MKFRPAATPLITVDPFFSIWSTDDALYGGKTEHWSGRPFPIMAGIYVNGRFYSMSAFDMNEKAIVNRIYQTDLKVTPTSSIYTFEDENARVSLTFTTPLLLDRLDIMSRPVSYVAYEIEKKREADVRFLFGIGTHGCVNDRTQMVGIKKSDFSICAGNLAQGHVPSQSGDNVLIDWGYLHLCDKDGAVGRFDDQRQLTVLPTNNTYVPYVDQPYLFVIKNELSGVVTLAYDEVCPLEYFGDPLKEYSTKYFGSFEDMAIAAKNEYNEIKKLCDELDASLMAESEKLGESYKNIISLAYRQAISAHKLAEDTDGKIVFLSKENDSNGCIGTLDVTYPSIPLFLKYNPELVKGMLRPIIKFALSDGWNFDFTPHDVGRYPFANGQVYGASSIDLGGYGKRFYGELREDMQMPVEEAGNMLICLAAVKKYSGGDTELFDENSSLMKQWADYLLKYGYDPKNQLCTDDFAGHLARNCNLSLKAILGLAAYAELSGDESYMNAAREYAKKWETDAKADHVGTRLTFDGAQGWSLKYNIVWDHILGYDLFSDEVKKQEIEVYKSKMNRYGVPLDSRSDYTKIDWLMWSTRIYDDKEYFGKVCESIVNMINETVDRVPLTDWYYTSTAAFHSFRNRTVVGGLFINLI